MPHNQNPILEKAATIVPTAAPASNTAKLDAVEEALAKSNERIATSIGNLEANVDKSQTATDVVKSAVSDISSANQITARAALIANLKAQNANTEVFEVSGGTDAQVVLMRNLKEDGDRVAELLDEKADIVDDVHTGIDMIDNIINGFRSSQLNRELGVAVQIQNHSSKQIANINAATESFARVNAITKKTLNEGVIEAELKAIAAEGRIKGAEAELKNIHSNATAMNALLTADSRNVNTLLQVFRLENEEKDRAIQVERRKFQQEQMDFAKKQWLIQGPAAEVALEQARLTLKNSQELSPTRIIAAERQLLAKEKAVTDQEELTASLVSRVQRGQSAAGIPVENKNTILFGLNSSGDRGKRYDRLLTMGAGAKPILGLTAFDAKKSLDIIAPDGNVAATKGVKLLALIAQKQAEKYDKSRAKIPRDEASQRVDFNVTAKEEIDKAKANIATGDNSNPYHSAPFTVLEQFKAVASTALYQKVLKALELKETNPQTIMDASIAGILSGTVSPEEAAEGIEAIFDTAALVNNTNEGGFRRVGLPNQTTYNTLLTRPPSFIEELKIAGKKALILPPLSIAVDVAGSLLKPNTLVPVDLMDVTEIKETIIKIMSTTRASVKEGGEE